MPPLTKPKIPNNSTMMFLCALFAFVCVVLLGVVLFSEGNKVWACLVGAFAGVLGFLTYRAMWEAELAAQVEKPKPKPLVVSAKAKQASDADDEDWDDD